jgi:pilus assembly protein CpaC
MRIRLALLAALFAATPMPAAAQEDGAKPKVTASDGPTSFSGKLEIEKGKSVVVETPRTPVAISLTDNTVADIVEIKGEGALRWQIRGVGIGTTDIVFSYGPGRRPEVYEVVVHRDLSELILRVDQIVSGPTPRIYPLMDRIVIEGVVDDLDTLERVALVASIYDPDFVNLMSVRGDHQVQLEVIYAEITRSVDREWGFNLATILPTGQTIALGNKALPTLTPVNGLQDLLLQQQLPNAFNAIVQLSTPINLAAALSLISTHNLAKVVSQPTVVSMSGQQVEFLSGGKVPILTPNQQGVLTVTYEKYGTQVRFTPTVLAGDMIDVQVGVTISEQDPGTGVSLQNALIPAFSERSISGHVRLRSGETFAIAGLLREQSSLVRKEVPGLGRIPVIGAFFRTVQHRRSETESLIYITPRLVRPLGPGEVPPPLGSTENNNPSDFMLLFMGADHRAKSRTAEPTGDIGLHR